MDFVKKFRKWKKNRTKTFVKSDASYACTVHICFFFWIGTAHVYSHSHIRSFQIEHTFVRNRTHIFFLRPVFLTTSVHSALFIVARLILVVSISILFVFVLFRFVRGWETKEKKKNRGEFKRIICRVRCALNAFSIYEQRISYTSHLFSHVYCVIQCVHSNIDLVTIEIMSDDFSTICCHSSFLFWDIHYYVSRPQIAVEVNDNCFLLFGSVCFFDVFLLYSFHGFLICILKWHMCVSADHFWHNVYVVVGLTPFIAA